jgi:hypothetical protein
MEQPQGPCGTQSPPQEAGLCDSFGDQEKNRAAHGRTSLKEARRKRNSPHKTEFDAKVVLTNAVIATVLLKGKLKSGYDEGKGKEIMTH